MKNKLISVILILTLIISTLSISVAEISTSVGDTGSDYESISSAINNTTGGAIILLTSDVEEDITIENDVTIDGNNHTLAGRIIISSGNVTIKNLNVLSYENAIEVNSSNSEINIINSTLSGGGDYGNGIRSNGENNNYIITESTLFGKFGTYLEENNSTISILRSTIEGQGIKGGFGGAGLLVGGISPLIEVTDSSIIGSNVAVSTDDDVIVNYYGNNTLTVTGDITDGASLVSLVGGDEYATSAVDENGYETVEFLQDIVSVNSSTPIINKLLPL